MTMNGTKKLYKKLQIVKTVKDTDWLLYLQTGSKKDKEKLFESHEKIREICKYLYRLTRVYCSIKTVQHYLVLYSSLCEFFQIKWRFREPQELSSGYGPD